MCCLTISPFLSKVNMLTFTFVAVWLASLAHAKHYQCSWDVLQGKKPAEAGFSKLCDPQLTEVEELGFYHCVLDASLNQYRYQLASWNVKPRELEWGEYCFVRLRHWMAFC